MHDFGLFFCFEDAVVEDDFGMFFCFEDAVNLNIKLVVKCCNE